MKSCFRLSLRPINLGKFDLGSVLYHANYFHLLEETRETFLEELGLPYPELVKASCHLAIVESHQSFKAPIYYGDPLEVSLEISDIKKTSAVFHYDIRNTSKDTIVHNAWTKLVFVEIINGAFKVRPMPEKLYTGFSQYAFTREP